MSEIEKAGLIENPEIGTAGLTSAIQLVDTTNEASFDFRNSSSDTPDFLAPSFPPEGKKEDSGDVFSPLVSGLQFEEAFEEALKKHKNILKKLADY